MQSKTMAPHQSSDIRAISENRKLVLDIAADLMDLVRERRIRLADSDFERRIVMCCVGAAFALWRAVPLVHTGGGRPIEAVQTAENYLDTIVRTNAITYGDDDRGRIWAFGFYMGNARYRISELCTDEIFSTWPGGRHALQARGLYDSATTPRKPGYDPATKLRDYIVALRAIIDAYRSEYSN